MKRWLLCLSAAVLLAPAVAAAPAPFERTTTVETVLITGTAARAKTLKAVLLSGAHLNRLLAVKEVRELACVRAANNQRKWLADRLKVEPIRGGTQVRIRLTGCPDRQGLVLLAALNASVTATSRGRGTREEMQRREVQLVRVAMMQRAVAAQQAGAAAGAMTKELGRVKEMMARYDLEANPPKVHRPPQRVRRP